MQETVVGKTRNSGEFPGPREIRFDDIVSCIVRQYFPATDLDLCPDHLSGHSRLMANGD